MYLTSLFLVLNNIAISVDFKRTLSEFRAALRVHSAEERARPGTGIFVDIFRLVIVHSHLRWRHANVETVLQRKEERGRRGAVLREHREAGNKIAGVQSESMSGQVKSKLLERTPGEKKKLEIQNSMVF